MPRPVSSRARYLPGLDGVRALAVIAVLGYHLEIPAFRGGLMGVGMFFTLSGYLITSLLLRSRDRTGGLELQRFWLQRARRLLPAVVLLLVVVLVATALVAPDDLGTRFGESVAAMFYVFNWTTIASEVSYFDRFGGPGTLDHLWSLAVEEQFYLLWPPALLLMLRRQRGRLERVAGITLLVAAASFLLMAVLAEPGFDNTRVYEGTDTRAGGLLVGAAVAMVWRLDRLTDRVMTGARLILDGIGLVALAVLGMLVVGTDPFSLSLYRGRLLALSIATVLLVAVVVQPASRLARVLGVAPLRWIGARSYGIYLWHLPIIVLTPATVLVDRPVVRAGIQVALTLVLAALSWTWLEDPIRRQGLVGAFTSPERIHWFTGRQLPRQAFGSVAVTVLGVLALVATASADGRVRDPQPVGAAAQLEVPIPTPVEPAAESTPGGAGTPGSGPSTEVRTPPPGGASETPAAGEVETACRRVVHVGDSTSLGLVNEEYMPDEQTRIPARYAAVGVADFAHEIDPAMSTVETHDGRPNAPTRVQSRLDDGYEGCWVFAMGTNEAANEAVGGGYPFEERIAFLMDPIDGMPALWLTVASLETTGPYADREMREFNEALLAACDRYPNLRIYDWRAEARDDWFGGDGIHFTLDGYVERSRRIAAALTAAFPPNGGPSEECVVGSGLDD